MASISDLFGNGSIGQQFLIWQVLGQIIGAAGQPGLTAISNEVNGLEPVVVLSPAQLADMVIRGFIAQGDAAGEAAQSGINGDRFQLMVDDAGNSIAPEEAAEALRRGLIGESGLGATSTSFQAAIAEGNLKDKWTDVIKALAVQIPTTAELVSAYVQAQIDMGTLTTRFAQAGGDPTWLADQINAYGEGPTPDQAGTLANRGIIPWSGIGAGATTFEQAVRESAFRDKWTGPLQALQQYLPPPRTVTAILRAGSITRARALQLYQMSGLSAEDAAAELADATSTKSATTKLLAESQVVGLYEGKLLTRAQALTQLQALGYTEADADYLLELADLKAAQSATQAGVTRIETLYTSGKDTAAQATEALSSLGLAASSITELLAVWDVEKTKVVRTLTVAQYAGAFYYGIMDQPTATAGIMNLGYDAYDAWVILGLRTHGPVTGEPPGYPVPPPPAPLAPIPAA